MIKDRLKEIEQKYNETSEMLARPEVVTNQELYQKYAREHASMKGIVEAYRELLRVEKELEGNKTILEGKDEELRELAKEEIPALQQEREGILSRIKIMLLPRDPNDDKNVILEIRAGAGGD